jgi:FAR-17a/AIG1-like protein
VTTHVAARVLRAAVALLATTALVVNLIHASDRPDFRLINYFSYFTNISNIFAVVVLTVAAIGDPSSRRFELVRGAATFCTTVTGVIYALFLSDVSVGVTDPWINNVIHRVVPVFMLLDWWLASRAPVAPREALRWLAIPIVYLAYTLIRGPLAGDWYPYPFVDPTRDGGYLRVALFSAAVSVALALLAFGLSKLGARHRAETAVA